MWSVPWPTTQTPTSDLKHVSPATQSVHCRQPIAAPSQKLHLNGSFSDDSNPVCLHGGEFELSENQGTFTVSGFPELPKGSLINGTKSKENTVMSCISSFLGVLYSPWDSVLADPSARI